MYLIDTNVISEARKKANANPGLARFFKHAIAWASRSTCPRYPWAKRRGVELIRHRGDTAQAEVLEAWLNGILEQYAENILHFDADAAQVWGRESLTPSMSLTSRSRPSLGQRSNGRYAQYRRFPRHWR